MSFFQKALALEPKNAAAYCNYGLCLYQLRRYDEAIAAFQTALRHNPSLVPPYVNLALFQMRKGDITAAEQTLLRALKIAPEQPRLWHHLTMLRRYTEADLPQVSAIEDRLKSVSPQSTDALEYHFVLGKVYDDMKRYEQAAHHYRQGNHLLRMLTKFNREAFSREIQATLATFTAPFFTKCSSLGNPSQQPVFIIGMPRSGTTLVHQILASHPAVLGIGEDDFFIRRFGALPAYYPGKTPQSAAEGLSANDIAAISQRYLDKHQRHMTGQSLICNKAPHNVEILGFIALLFPNARIIHCRRDARDTALSIYFQKFIEGNPFANSFEDIAYYYQHYEQLIAHWQRHLSLPFHEVQYETLLQKPEEVIRDLLTFCGLEWHPDCLEFQRSSAPVETASAWQVRQPLYQSSLGRWQHYAPYLPELEAAFNSLSVAV